LRGKCILLVSDVALLRQTFALLLERWTGLRTVQAESPAGGRGLLADLNGDIVLAVVSVDTPDGPDTGLIKVLRNLGLPVLAFGLEESTGPLARALDAGAEDAISLGEPVSYLIDKAAQLVMPGPVITNGETTSRR
jgi:DNA-binding NarL/FixJ family response regulator